jgi:hypothetical protein
LFRKILKKIFFEIIGWEAPADGTADFGFFLVGAALCDASEGITGVSKVMDGVAAVFGEDEGGRWKCCSRV